MKKVIVKIKGKETLFSNLKLTQELCELHSFSFNCQIESPNGVTLQSYIDFYDTVIDMPVEIEVEQKKIFEGIILSAECINQYDFYIDFKISGHCKTFLVDQEEQHNIFHKRSLSEIFKAMTADVPAIIQPMYSEPLHYTVQYAITSFKMMQMLCRREGEWMYYDGTQIVIKRPDAKPIKLDQSKNEIFDIQLSMKMPSKAAKIGGYDILKASTYTSSANKSAGNKQSLPGFVQSKQKMADDIKINATVPFETSIKRAEELYKAQWLSNTLRLKGKTNNPAVVIGSVIEILNGGKSEGIYIVSEITHFSKETTEYYNHFEAVTEDDKYPPYIDPGAKIESPIQFATITQNEDADGLGRIKAKFWWHDKETCWMDVVTPHAGAGRGFRFLPEIGDFVMIDFWENNIEAPFMLSSMYGGDAKDGVKETGNHIKKIATKTNRRFQINDDEGIMLLNDSDAETKYTGNIIHFEKNDKKQSLYLASEKDEKNVSAIQLNQENNIHIAIIEDGEKTIEIKLDREGQKMKIFAKKEITIHSENNVNVKASNINIEADQSIKMKTKKFELKSDEVKIDAAMDLEITTGMKLELKGGTQTTVNGGATLNLEGGAKTVLKGGVVMIN